MAQTVLIIGTAGAEDPTKATMPLVIARGLQETGNDCKIVLMGQAGMLVNPTCAGNVQAVGFPKYTDLYDGLNAGKFGAGKVDYVV